MHNCSSVFDLRETIQCNGNNVSLGFLELKMHFFVPFPQAAQRDNIDCVSVLLDYNADPNLIDFSGNTAFHHAVSRGNLPIVQMFLKHNVDIEAKTEVKITQLHSQCTSSSDSHLFSTCRSSNFLTESVHRNAVLSKYVFHNFGS